MHARFSAMKTGLIKIKSRVIWSLGKGCQVRWAARKRKYGVWWHWTWMSPSHTSFIKSLSHNSTGKDPRSLNKVVISHNCFIVLVIDLFWKHSKTPWPAEPSRLSSVTLWRPTVHIIKAPHSAPGSFRVSSSRYWKPSPFFPPVGL